MNRTMNRWGAVAALAALALFGTALFAEPAYACPVCFDRDDEARMAFLATAGLLTLLPFGLVIGTGAWLRKRARGEGRVDTAEPGMEIPQNEP